MKIWGVRNFYSNLERLSREGSEFSLGFFALVVSSAFLAGGGLLANNVAVIIGSMCVAPFLGSSRAICVGWVYRQWNSVAKGLSKQILGLFAIGTVISFLITITLSWLTPNTTLTPEIMARTLPTVKDFYLAVLIAITSGAAASLALVATPRIVSQPWQELVDAMIGVEISVSLLPPASVMGIGLAFGRVDIVLSSFTLLLINLIGLNVIGGISVLSLWGIKPQLLQLEKRISKISEDTLNEVAKADELSIDVTLHSYTNADIRVNLQTTETPNQKHQLIAEIIAEAIKKETGVSNCVKIIVTPVCICSS